MVYNEDDEIDGFYFMTKGLGAFILPKLSGMVFAIIDPQKTMNKSGRRMHLFQYHGIEDSIYNHLRLMLTKKKGEDTVINRLTDKLLSKRRYSVQCIKQMEGLKMEQSAVDRMKKDFQATSRRFFKEMIDQFRMIVQYNIHCTGKFNHFRQYSKHNKN
jgi:hypothetical protein